MGLRDTIKSLSRTLIPTPDGAQIPLEELAEIRYVRRPQMIKRENTVQMVPVLYCGREELRLR
ncbi:MAG: hypothetical protein ACUVSA_11275 [Desulfosoma sp.]|uniref:hypothetical protein n=1 Tax=Desulfosoma sp. TaxID=2603217 RepID=UPI004049345F